MQGSHARQAGSCARHGRGECAGWQDGGGWVRVQQARACTRLPTALHYSVGVQPQHKEPRKPFFWEPNNSIPVPLLRGNAQPLQCQNSACRPPAGVWDLGLCTISDSTADEVAPCHWGGGGGGGVGVVQDPKPAA